MKPELETFTVVAAGAWNPAIVSPEWLASNVIQSEPVELEVAITPAGMVQRIRSASLLFVPHRAHLLVGVLNHPEDLTQATMAMAKVLEVLSHTPVSAIGINLGFSVQPDGLSQALHQTFAAEDDTQLNRLGWEIKTRDISRSLAGASQHLNLRLRLLADSSAQLHFNFHRDVGSAIEATAWLREQSVPTMLCTARDIAANAYGLHHEAANE